METKIMFFNFRQFVKRVRSQCLCVFLARQKNCGCSEKMFDDTSCPRSVLLSFWRNLMITVERSCNLQSCSKFNDGFVTLHQFSNLLTKKTQARREAKEYLLQSLEKDTPTCCYVWKLYSSYWHSAAFFFSFTLPLCKFKFYFIDFLLCEWGKGPSPRNLILPIIIAWFALQI